MKLYEIKDSYLTFQDAIERGEVPVEAIGDTLEAIKGELEEKADNIACLIKSLVAQAAAIKLEEESLSERRKAKERQADGMKTYLANTLAALGKDKLETPRNLLSFRKSTALEIEDEGTFILQAALHGARYLAYREPSIDRRAVTDALKSGEEVAGAQLVTRQNLQIR